MSYLGRQRRIGRLIFTATSFTQIIFSLLLVFVLQKMGTTPVVANAISASLLAYGLAGVWLWELKYAIPERPVPKVLWLGLVIPGFFLQTLGVAGIAFSALFLFFENPWPWFFVSLLMAIYVLRIGPRWVRFHHKTLELQNLPKNFAGYRVAHISDIHIGQFVSPKRLNKVVQQINHQALDAVFITGDLITFGSHFVHLIAKNLGEIKARDGVFLCLGNHDYYTLKINDLIKSLRHEGITVLLNQHKIITRGEDQIAILGLDGVVDLPKVEEKLLAKTLSTVPPNTCCLLLAHDPLVFPAASERGIALTLSGHTHGGQLALPLFNRINTVSLSYPHNAGLYRLEKSLLYVSTGFGLAHFPARFGVRPEVAFFTLIPADQRK